MRSTSPRLVGILAGLALWSVMASGAFVITGTGTSQRYALPPATTGTPVYVLLTATGGVRHLSGA